MIITSDCISCKHLIKVEHSRTNNSVKMICAAFPDGIPLEISSGNKTEGVICANNIAYMPINHGKKGDD